jgi:hypothetical protein
MNEGQSLAELVSMQAGLKQSIQTLTNERNSLPRNDKENAHRLLTQINQLMAEEKRLRPRVAAAREADQKHENHSLWCACVLELYGQEDLSLCFEWMKQERKKRRCKGEQA